MSDRTKVTANPDDDTVVQPRVEGGDAPGGGSDGAPTRADRLMGRAPETGSGRPGGGQQPPAGRPGQGGSPAGAASGGAARGDRPGRAGTGAGAPGQPGGQGRPAGEGAAKGAGAAAGAAAGSAAPAASGGQPQRPVRNQPSDAWSKTSADQRRGGSPDDEPTRVNRPVAFQPPQGAAGGAPAEVADRPATSDASAQQTATPQRAGSEKTEDGSTEVLVGTGALTTVSGSMKEPAATETSAGAKAAAARKPRRARLRLSRIDPWSVMKMSFLFSIAAGIAMWVAVAFVWWVLQTSGLFQGVNDAVTSMLAAPGDADPFRLEEYVNGPRVLGATALLAVVDVLLITAISTVASFLYNLGATMLGGLQVTLAETDD
ncbi:hypothetical protein DT076_06745 [Desertihabitans brevis]|uniref:DUF3566 domain-containing protein n=1 Tax=Desertihabitans brevis TaxID=2268447 RepID=A0A367YWU2_9ACTN|nr:DUF3566 domain-containing protein [Desertihabitans brevis]RCK70344.1 hypothetical protein DT076_06745 [Desertihabitans brevis]